METNLSYNGVSGAEDRHFLLTGYIAFFNNSLIPNLESNSLIPNLTTNHFLLPFMGKPSFVCLENLEKKKKTIKV